MTLDVGAVLARCEHSRQPEMPNSAVPDGNDRRRDDVDRARQDRDLEALLLVEALVEGGEVAGDWD